MRLHLPPLHIRSVPWFGVGVITTPTWLYGMGHLAKWMGLI